MAFLNWRARKQIVAFLVVFSFIGIVVGAFIYFSRPDPTCFDNEQNQMEEGIDCGGPCTPCVINPKDIVTLWTRVMRMDEGLYEAASLIENSNLFYGLRAFKYTFKLYDDSNILVAAKEGRTFLNPQDKFAIFETQIGTGRREATKAFMELEYLSLWEYLVKERPSLVVSGKNFSNTPFPVLSAHLFNQSLFEVKDIYVSVVLYDGVGNAMAVSSTRLDSLAGESGRNITFTWPAPFDEMPSSSEIFTRINLFEN